MTLCDIRDDKVDVTGGSTSLGEVLRDDMTRSSSCIPLGDDGDVQMSGSDGI